MKVETTRFGALEVDKGSMVKMLTGPFGFEDQTEFCLIQHRSDTSFRWLQSTKIPDLAFVVVDPMEFFSDYEIEISDADAEKLHLTCEEDALVLTIVTIKNGGTSITANLIAPIIVNSRELLGAQIILQNEQYTTKHELVKKEHKQQPDSAFLKAA